MLAPRSPVRSPRSARTKTAKRLTTGRLWRMEPSWHRSITRSMLPTSRRPTRNCNRHGPIRSAPGANVLQVKAKLVQAQQDWNRAQKLGHSEALAPSAYDQYKANYEVAKANVAVTHAAVKQAKAAVAQAQASLNRAQRNLSYCTIKSPVKGVIIDRRVNIGQTVVSSLNAPSLFLIAKDLTRIQVWVSVNEADIGNIHPGLPTTFTVDAFPNQVFHGQVGKVRLNATMTQNVVTYTVVVNTDNSDGKLLCPTSLPT